MHGKFRLLSPGLPKKNVPWVQYRQRVSTTFWTQKKLKVFLVLLTAGIRTLDLWISSLMLTN